MTHCKERPTVALVGTGGTISFDGRDRLDRYEYMEFGERHDIHEVIARFPEVNAVVEIRPIAFRH